jgi:mRNA interferase RelE/StbE
VSYQVLIRRRAMEELAAVSRPDYERIKSAVGSLAQNPRPPGAQKLRAREGWRIRVGDFRVIYEIDDGLRQVIVLRVGHRREIYR